MASLSHVAHTRDPWHIKPSPPPLNQVFEKMDCSDLPQDKDNLKQAVLSKYVFWLAFCKAASEMKLRPSRLFAIKIRKEADREYIEVLGISEHSESIQAVEKLQKTVEKIRVFFKDSLEDSRPITFVWIIDENRCYFRRKAPLINLADWIHHPDYTHHASDKHTFKHIVRPVIPTLAKIVGMSCEISEVQQMVRSEYIDSNDKKVDCEAITVKALANDSENH